MRSDSEHERYMRRCLELARRALHTDDTPVGSLVVRDDRILAEGVEGVRRRCDVTAHAEIEALRAAFQSLGSSDLAGCTLYTSVEPCVMCAYAIRLARIDVVVIGASPSTAGASVPDVLTAPAALPTRPVPEVVRGVLAPDCLAVLRLQPG